MLVGPRVLWPDVRTIFLETRCCGIPWRRTTTAIPLYTTRWTCRCRSRVAWHLECDGVGRGVGVRGRT